MSAKLRVLDAMLAIAVQFSKSPDRGIRAAATDEMLELTKKRAKLLKQEEAASQPATEGAGRELAMQG